MTIFRKTEPSIVVPINLCVPSYAMQGDQVTTAIPNTGGAGSWFSTNGAAAQLAYVSSFITKVFGAAKPRRCSAYRSSRCNWSKKCASHSQSCGQGTELSATAPLVPPWGYSHTYSLQTIQWRRSRRRIEPVPLRPSQIDSITRGHLLDALLDAWLCCSELGLGNDIFDIASVVSAEML